MEGAFYLDLLTKGCYKYGIIPQAQVMSMHKMFDTSIEVCTLRLHIAPFNT